MILDTDIEGTTEVDAVQRRWTQLKNKITTGYDLPDNFPDAGLLVDPMPGRRSKGTLPRIGVWLMPNNKAFGMFEDLLMESLGVNEKDHLAIYLTPPGTTGCGLTGFVNGTGSI